MEEIQGRLMKAAREIQPAKSSGSIQQAKNLFEQLSQEGALLCVEYRDLPRTNAGSQYEPLAKLAGLALANGLCFAMFQPFGSDDLQNDRSKILPASVCRYRADIAEQVRDIHLQMLAHAQRAQTEQTGSPQRDLTNRLVLYEQTKDHADLAGFQSRLFYAVIPENEYEDKRQIWEWISQEGGEDLFVLRSNLTLPVIYQQFFEVTAYWHHKKILPISEQELQAGSRLATEMDWIHWDKPPKPRWKVFENQLIRKTINSEGTRTHGKKPTSRV